MKRRLDLALALLHNPRILFLDEPTTGLDVQSRTALWDEVARLAREEGTTVFLTTQYLEEADVLADRVGIIDRGTIVAEGTPAALKAQVSKPTVEVVPRDADDCAAARAALEPFGEPVAERAAGLDRRAPGLRRRAARRHRARAGRTRTSPSPTSRCTSRRSTTSSSRRPGAASRARPSRRRGGRGAGGARSGPRRERRRAQQRRAGRQVGLLAGRSVLHVVRSPAQLVFPIVFPLILLAVNTSGLDAATQLPGFPTDSYLDFALAVPFMQGALFAALNGGQDLARDIENGFLDRLALTPMSGAALLAGQLGGALFMGVISAVLYLVVGLAFGVGIATGVGGALVLLVLAVTISSAFACFGTFVALRAGTGEAVQGFFPLFFVLLFLSSAFFPRDLIEQEWFRTIATYNPVSYMVEGIRSLVITGWDAAARWRRRSRSPRSRSSCFLALSARALRTRLVRT